ncbi:MAG TPA: hypothetical protein VEW47_04815 [Candidatus Dormibacteraeota bacterium]|nr:hypothetical protein [Candidatus Dormibacteraeota bacterium]
MRKFLLSAVCAGLFVGLVLADGSGANHQVRTMSFGSSGGNANDITRFFCCGGTLGSLVTKGGIQYILSNNHVLARVDQAAVGEDITQPGLIDNGCSVATVVADFSQAVPLGTQNVDAALAAVRPGLMDAGGKILDIGVPCATPGTPRVGLAVAKSGRTTGCQQGTIASISTNVNVQYQRSCGKGKKFVIAYTNQVVINSTTFSAGGDSGSLILSGSCSNTGSETNGDNAPVALLFAGSSSSTIGNPIQDVIGSLGVGFVGTSTCTAPTSASAATGFGREPLQNDLDFATMVKDRHAPDMMRNPEIIGVGVGVMDDDPSRVALVVYVDSTRPVQSRVPTQVDGVPVKVVRTDPFVAY